MDYFLPVKTKLSHRLNASHDFVETGLIFFLNFKAEATTNLLKLAISDICDINGESPGSVWCERVACSDKCRENYHPTLQLYRDFILS